MQDFPPIVDAPGAPATGSRRRTRNFGHPDTRSPSRFLIWTLSQQPGPLLLCAGTSVLEWLPGALGPWVVGRVIDVGIIPRDLGAVVSFGLILLGISIVGIAANQFNHTFTVRAWLIGMYATMKLVTRKTTQLGHVLPRRTPTGEVLSVAASDAEAFGELTEIVTRSAGAIVSFLVIAGLVLWTSPDLGVVVLLAAPVVVFLATPLLRPLQRREDVERSRSSDLTSMATDIVAGLRILRGIGGEQTFARNYAVQSQSTRRAGVSAGVWQALVDSTGVLLSGLFLVSLTWLGAREVLAGALSVGELISFFGYALFLLWPIQTFFELAQKWIRCLVSARKTLAVIELAPPWVAAEAPTALPVDTALHDQVSGFVARPGELTLVVSAVPDDSAALADRLGRYLPDEQDPVSTEALTGLQGRAARRAQDAVRNKQRALAERDLERTVGDWGVSLGGVDLAAMPLTEVRRRILVSDTSSQLFAGTLQRAIDPHGTLTRPEAERVVHVASAEDIFEALPGGWQGRLDERGRGLSGGQRQRVVLARALAQQAEILVLVEPTSAVDAHTEARIAGRLAAYRRGRTTVVMSASPLLLHHADRVVLLIDGQVAAVGTHDGLLTTDPAYRRVVARAMEEADSHA